MTEDEGKKRGLISLFIWENIQTIFFAILAMLGLRFASTKESGGQQPTAEKESSDFILSHFPNWTEDDKKEYNLLLDSHEKKEARIAAEEFDKAVEEDDRYDLTQYRVAIVLLRREFIERMRHPAPKDDSGGRLNFDTLTIRDSAIIFMDRLLEEKEKGGSSKEIYERQREIAVRRELLKEKNLFKRVSENKIGALMTAIFIIFGVYCLVQILP